MPAATHPRSPRGPKTKPPPNSLQYPSPASPPCFPAAKSIAPPSASACRLSAWPAPSKWPAPHGPSDRTGSPSSPPPSRQSAPRRGPPPPTPASHWPSSTAPWATSRTLSPSGISNPCMTPKPPRPAWAQPLWRQAPPSAPAAPQAAAQSAPSPSLPRLRAQPRLSSLLASRRAWQRFAATLRRQIDHRAIHRREVFDGHSLDRLRRHLARIVQISKQAPPVSESRVVSRQQRRQVRVVGEPPQCPHPDLRLHPRQSLRVPLPGLQLPQDSVQHFLHIVERVPRRGRQQEQEQVGFARGRKSRLRHRRLRDSLLHQLPLQNPRPPRQQRLNHVQNRVVPAVLAWPLVADRHQPLRRCAHHRRFRSQLRRFLRVQPRWRRPRWNPAKIFVRQRRRVRGI